MASEDDVTSDSLDVIVTDVPENLQGYVKTKVAEYITQSKDVSMKIHQVQGQSPKLVMTFGSNTGRGTQIPSGNELTRTIFVRNIPESATEDLLEAFFESKRKYGGGPVKSVKIIKDKKIAIVEFCDASSVDEVLKKKPIMLGTTELDVTPFKLLLSGNDHITQADVKGINLPKDFTENLLRNHSEYSDPSYDRELAAKITPLTRVVRGRDWCHGSQTASQALVVPGQEPLTATMLAAAPLPEQKQMLGERLFPLIQRMHPDLAWKITGMLLEIDNSKLLHMLESTESLKAKVEQAVAVLPAHQAKESAHQQAAAAVKKE